MNEAGGEEMPGLNHLRRVPAIPMRFTARERPTKCARGPAIRLTDDRASAPCPREPVAGLWQRRTAVRWGASFSRRLFLFLCGALVGARKRSPAKAAWQDAAGAAMSPSVPPSSDGQFRAYLTTELVDGPRVPISAERIVVVLGDDELGHPLELSIVLNKPRDAAKKL